ncbi:MAG: fibronectin type III domain-containing protein [Thermoplasmata archaeon]|nr:fibronectin type III domain-containing protein [Thermoplasmata archaeon]
MNRGALLPILIIGAMLMNTLPMAMGDPIQDGHPWSSPLDDGNSAVTRYYLYRHDWEEGNLTELTEQELSYMDHDVEQGRSYNYTVYALNEAGKGAGGLVDITVPLPEAGPPEDSQTTPWALLVMVLVLTFVAVALVVMRGRGGIPGQAIL